MPTTAESVLKVLGQINPLVGAAASIIGTIRDIRASAIAANPAIAAELPDDKILIGNLLTSAGLLKTEAGELKSWLQDLIDKESQGGASR